MTNVWIGKMEQCGCIIVIVTKADLEMLGRWWWANRRSTQMISIFNTGLPPLTLWQSVAQSSQISSEKQVNELHRNDMQNQCMIESGPLPLPYSSSETAVGVRGSVGRGQGRKERSLLFQRTAALSSTGAPQHNLHTTELTHTRPAQHVQHILQLHQHSTCSPHAFCLLQLVLQHFSRWSEHSVAQS